MKGTDLKFYLSGALSVGGSQSNPSRALGGFISSTEIVNKKNATSPVNITGVIINTLYGASVGNANGVGTLTFINGTPKTLQWTAPNDVIGSTVAINSNGTYILYSGTQLMWLVVDVISANLPIINASDSITISENPNTMNNLFSDTMPVRAAVGDIVHRAFFLKNTHTSQSLQNAKIFISKATDYDADLIEFAIENPTSRTNGYIQEILNENKSPSGLGTLVNGISTWYRVTTKETAIKLPGSLHLASDEFIGLWYRRIVSPKSDKFKNNIFNITVWGDVPSLES